MTAEQNVIIDRIVSTLLLKFYNCVQQFDKPEEYANVLSKICRSDSGLALSSLFLNLKNIDDDKAFFPKELNKELAKMLAEESENYLSNPSDLSKILKQLANDGIFLNVEGKKDIKNRSPNSLPRKRKTGEAKRKGYYSVYRLEDEVKLYRKILSDHNAINVVNERLKQSGLLQKAYYTIAMATFQGVMREDEGISKFGRMSVSAIDPSQQQPSEAEWQKYREALLSLDDNELKDIAKQFTDQLLENPSNCLFFALSLPKLEF